MFYEKITQKELDRMELDNGTTPNFTYKEFVSDEENGDYYINLTIHKTSEAVYLEWLADKDKPLIPQPTIEEQLAEANKRSVSLEAKVAAQEEEKKILAQNVYDLASVVEMMLTTDVGGTPT